MAEYQTLAVIAGFALLYSLVASRLERTPVNGALVYVIVGFLCGSYVFGLIDVKIEGETLKTLAELTLALVLFTDSASINLATLRRVELIPTRLLLIGLPLTILFGFGVAYLIFDDLGLFEIALLATMLAPTDAALGKAVVTNENVPDSVRESLNVESGLNDGICVPVLLFFLVLAAGQTDPDEAKSLVFALPLQAIGIGALVGTVGGVLGSQVLKFCAERNWVADTWIQTPVIALALLCFGTSQWFGGSGFIACFVGGLLFGGLAKNHKGKYLDAAEGIGDLMMLMTWFLFGAAAIGLTWQFLDWRVVVYALLSLTIIRILPVFLCVFGLKLQFDTKVFVGWFGPRGLASIVFIVMVLAENLPGSNILLTTVTWTILLSVVLHGITANPLAKLYGSRITGSKQKI
jgi:NhaP-type Na+/H+ or K+/H+ antiporter